MVLRPTAVADGRSSIRSRGERAWLGISHFETRSQMLGGCTLQRCDADALVVERGPLAEVRGAGRQEEIRAAAIAKMAPLRSQDDVAALTRVVPETDDHRGAP